MSLFEELMSGLESGATIIALIIGGLWTYWLFIRHRTGKPRADISHVVSTVALSSKDILVHVEVKVRNTSKILMTLESGIVRLEMLLPLHPEIDRKLKDGIDPVNEGHTQVMWPQRLERMFSWRSEPRIIEPSEIGAFYFDFFVPLDTTVIEIYSHLKNVAIHKRDIGWNTRTIHNIQNHKKGEAMTLRMHANPKPKPPQQPPPGQGPIEP